MAVDEFDEAGEITDDTWIIVPRWDEFQHYRNRRPPWIKNYTRLLADPDYLALSMAERGVLHTIWLAYCQCGTQLSYRRYKAYRGPVSNIHPQLIALNHAGFIELSASKPLAPSREVEREIETPSPLTDEDTYRMLKVRAGDIAADWNGGTSELFDERLDALEESHQMKLSYTDRAQFWDVARRRDPKRPVRTG